MSVCVYRRQEKGAAEARRTRSARFLLRAGASIVALASICAAVCAKDEPTAYQIEAVYLLNFSKFVQWHMGTPADKPADRNQPFEICVLGEDPFGPSLDATLSGESIHGASLVARRIATPQEITGCQILFISGSEDSHLKDVLAVLDRTGVLTVSDIPHFSERGGMIQFVLTEGKVRFEVNVTNAENAGLTLSSDLLEVAVAVRKES